MRYPLAAIGFLVAFLTLGQPMRLETREFSELEPTPATARRIKWPGRTIELSFSTSLLNPGSSIKPGSDVVGAAKRALLRWSSNASLKFVTTWSTTTSVSPAHSGDGISLITIADTDENQEFNAESTTGRTRVFFDPESGIIEEADISINPKPRSAEGADIQFSTDGTPGTYDLEATFTHEIGHLLGLDHSSVLASTMQSHQAFNGTYGLPALTERTLSEEDRQRIRSLYGSKQRLGRIEGRLSETLNSSTIVPLQSVHVWAEIVTTGRVVASDVSAEDGSYVLSELAAGKYRVLVSPNGIDKLNSAQLSSHAVTTRRLPSVEISSQTIVNGDVATTLNYNLLPSQSAQAKLNPRLIGLNGDLSVVALPLEPGSKVKVYLSGEGIDNVPGTSISVNSPFFTVDAATLTREQLPTVLPVVSFELNIAANAPFGDYTLRLQSNTGEVAYVPGALTIDPGVVASVFNPVDDPRFFVTQHYSDITGRKASSELVERMASQLLQCWSRIDCLRSRRLDISTSLFVDDELPVAGFVHGLYSVALGRRPKFSEFNADRVLLANHGSEFDANRHALALAFVERPEFRLKYSQSKGVQFVDALISSATETTGVNLESERDALLALYDGTNEGNAKILSRIITRPAFADAHYNQTFILMQYFAYLRRDPDKDGYDFWVNVLKNKPVRDRTAARSVVCAFLNSAEYQSRFAMADAHNASACN
jgi:Matrixin/Domain of unknown function (DUF4214)